MDHSEVMAEFEQADAILNGHFILSSGLRSKTYLQCARALMDPKRADRLCSALADKCKDTIDISTIDMVVAPAMGGVVVGYEMARQLGIEGIFCERVDGTFTLRRGFDIPSGANILVVEDVVTTGKSSMEAIDCIESHGGNVVAEACLVNRNAGKNPLEGDIPLISLMDLMVKTYQPDQLPPELESIPAIKPGSRGLK